MNKTPYTMQNRNERMNELMRDLNSEGVVTRSEYSAKKGIKFGCTQKKIDEYINQLIKAGLVIENEKGNLEWISKT